MKKRTYLGPTDLQLLQDFNAAAIALTDHCGYLHPGDIPHHMFNGNRRFDPVDTLTIWEDHEGIAAWLLIAPGHKSFDAQVRPDLKGSPLEREMLEFAAERTVELMRKYDIVGDKIFADAFRDDPSRAKLLLDLGWKLDTTEVPYVLNRLDIPPVTVPDLPEGFTYRSARGLEDAGKLAEVHHASFGSNWTEDTYRKVMQSPGYDPTRELVIEAPDGTFTAFTLTWHDTLNHMGLFEPVGTHKAFQRQGFGRALMLYGLQQMRQAGMKYASVAHFGSNAAAQGLYQSLGFRPWHLQDDYKKRIVQEDE